MKATRQILIIGIGIVGLTACTATTRNTHFLKNVAIDGAGLPGMSVDAKQRFVWAPTRRKKDSTIDYILCAEPSPDALSQLASALAVKAQLKVATTSGTDVGVGGGLEKSFSEAAQNIGKRTATIQLLRDGLYRACEAYMNDAIDDFGYSLVLGNIDSIMVKLVALESLSEGVAPSTKEGKNAVAAFEAAKLELEQLERDITQARASEAVARSRTDSALSKFDAESTRVVGLKKKMSSIEAALSKRKADLAAEEKKAASPGRDAKIKTLNASIAADEQQIIDVDANIATVDSKALKAKSRFDTTNSQLVAATSHLAALTAKLPPARGKVTSTAAAAAGIDKQLAEGSADAIVKIALHQNDPLSLVPACLAWTAKHNGNGNAVMKGYCDDILALLKRSPAKEAMQ